MFEQEKKAFLKKKQVFSKDKTRNWQLKEILCYFIGFFFLNLFKSWFFLQH